MKNPDELRLLRRAVSAIRRLNEAGVPVLVVTNQRGIALGRMSEHDLEAVHRELSAQLQETAAAHVDAFFHCPHDEGVCDCRKPGVGMFRQALARFPELRFDQSVIIGDSPSDIEAGRAPGMATIHLGNEAADLADAVDRLLVVAGP